MKKPAKTTALASELTTAENAQAKYPWLTTPLVAHEAWRAALILADRGYAEHTTRMAQSHFNRFCSWMAGEGHDLASVKGDDISRFLGTLCGRNGQPAGLRTRRMYLAEIDRVLAQLVQEDKRTDRPTAEIIAQARLSAPLHSRDIVLPPPAFAKRVKAHLQALVAGVPSTAPSLGQRRQLRDAALIALMLGCGLTPKELRRMVLKNYVTRTAQKAPHVHAVGYRLLSMRDIDLPEWVDTILAAWVRARKAQVLSSAGELDATPWDRAHLFARAGAGKPGPLDEHTIHYTVKSACEEAGAGGAVGPQMLRNVFIAELLLADTPFSEIARLAGLHGHAQIFAVQQVLRKAFSA